LLVASAFGVRRAPIGQTLKMVLAWVLIFAAVFVVIALRDDFSALGRRVWAEVSGGATVEQGAGGELRIRRAEDGHFYVDAELNGRNVRFMIDSGATVTSISRETANAIGVETGGFSVPVNTANGMVMMQRGRVSTLRVASIERTDFPVLVSDTGGLANLMGMNFLSSLSYWGVEGRTLVLRP